MHVILSGVRSTKPKNDRYGKRGCGKRHPNIYVLRT